MKIDYLSCTKILYFAEKILQDKYHNLPDVDDTFAKNYFGMTIQEVKEIIDQFEHDDLLVWHDESVEIEDNKYDNNMTSELSYDVLGVNKTKTKELVKYLKERYFLRETPFISREAVVSIAEQIKRVLNKDAWMEVVNKVSNGRNMVDDKKYTLSDFLFRHAYDHEEPLSFILTEFINPIYYDIHTKDASGKLFEYIDVVLSTSANQKDYKEWLKESAKYISVKKQDPVLSVNSHQLSNADKKKLYILEKLKEEWDLVPKQNSEPMRVNGRTIYGRRARETNASWERYAGWQHESEMDYYQLENVLTGFQSEGLINNFEFINDSAR